MNGLWLDPTPLTLASNSRIRASILTEAGLPIEIRPADIDEREVEAAMSGDGASPANVAGALAAAKAIDVSVRTPGRLVLGADQTLALEGRRFDKPRDMADGRHQLAALSGRTHTLFSGVALARDGVVVWCGLDEARLSMRPLSDGFLASYLSLAGDAVLTSVGGYQFEGLGAHLFERVEGDYRTILGLPLLPVLAALRDLRTLAV